tara:strand:+ start:697 stop:1665 length:969 start_codon:yes stop_codon:yes gene_type:complete
MSSAKISIVLSCYNGEKFLEDTIKSVLHQSHSNFTLFLINNGSIDNSLGIMKKYEIKDSRIKVINHEVNSSRASRINEVLEIITDRWVALIDADDIMLKNKIEVQLAYLNKYPEIKVLGCLATYITSTEKSFGLALNRLEKHNSCFELIRKGKNIGTPPSGVIMETEVIKKIGGFRGEFWPADDTDLWNRVAENGFIVYALPKVLLKYRIHSESFSANKFIEVKIKNEWMNRCLNLRLKNEKEISFDDFYKNFKKKSFIYKFQFYTKIYSDMYFRKSVKFLVDKKFIIFFYYITLSFFLNPFRIFLKILQRIRSLLSTKNNF